MEIYFVTGNRHKFSEAKRIIPFLEQAEMDISELQHFDQEKIVRDKAERAWQQLGKPLIVEDTGLYLDCLNGFPGPLVKWAMKTMGPEKLAELAERLGDARAEARTTVCLMDGEKTLFFSGSTKGELVMPRTTSEFDWDLIFSPDGHEETYAEMDKEDKNRISQRGKAFRKLAEHLSQRQ